MYENIYTYYEEIKGKIVFMNFIPNFREDVALVNDTDVILSDGQIKRIRSDENSQELYVSENTSWVLINSKTLTTVYVTERTKKITTSLGSNWNKELNRILEKCKKEYFRKQNEEVRLYFYNIDTEKLNLCCYNYKDGGDLNKYNYGLRRLLNDNPICRIDSRYGLPAESCFILGRIRRTIGLKNSRLMDFIEPVAQVKLDFKNVPYDWEGYGYIRDKEDLELDLYNLLRFCVLKKQTQEQVMRVREYLNDYDSKDIEVINQFKSKIQQSFKNGNLKELRQLARELNK